MATEILDLETAFKLTVKNVYEGNYFSIPFQRFEDDETTPEDWPEADYQFAVSANQSGTPNLFTLKSTSGQIVIVGNLLTVVCLDSENIMKGAPHGRSYYYELSADFGGGQTVPQGKGTIHVNYSVAK